MNWTDPNGYFALAPFFVGGGLGAISGAMGAFAQQGWTWSNVGYSAAIGFGLGAAAAGLPLVAAYFGTSISPVYIGMLTGELGNLAGQLQTRKCRESIDPWSMLGLIIGSGVGAPLKPALNAALQNELIGFAASPNAANLLSSWATFGPSVLMPWTLSTIGKQIGR